MRTAFAMVLGVALGFGLVGCQKKAATSHAAPGTPHRRGRTQKAQTPEELDTPLATIGDVTITLGEFQQLINRQSPYVRARYTSLAQKQEFLEAMIRFEVLAKEAYRRGLDKDPDVVRTMKQAMIEKLMRQELDSKITADTITDAEMKAYYDQHVADFVRPEQVRASAIILRSKAQGERVLIEARGQAGATDAGFRKLVAKYSVDAETKLRAGDLRYFDASNTDLPAPVVKAAFALANIGDVSDVIAAGHRKYYILKETGRLRAFTRSFEQAKPIIRNELFRKKRLQAENDFVDNLRAHAKIQIFEDNLKKVRIGASATGDGHGRTEMPPPAHHAPAGSASPHAGSAAPTAGSAAAPHSAGSAKQPSR